MGRGGKTKRISAMRKDERRAKNGLPPVSSRPKTEIPSWIDSLNSYLLSELNSGHGYSWRREHGYCVYSGDDTKLQLRYNPLVLSKDRGRANYHERQASLTLHVQIPEKSPITLDKIDLTAGVAKSRREDLSVDVVREGKSAMLKIRVSKPGLEKERTSVTQDYNTFLKTILEKLNKQ